LQGTVVCALRFIGEAFRFGKRRHGAGRAVGGARVGHGAATQGRQRQQGEKKGFGIHGKGLSTDQGRAAEASGLRARLVAGSAPLNRVSSNLKRSRRYTPLRV